MVGGHRPEEREEPDRPRSTGPSLDPGLEAICLKAIAREPEGRHATMLEFADALGAHLAGTVAGPSSASTHSRADLPAPGPGSLAVQVFAGLVSQETTSIRGERPPEGPTRRRPIPAVAVIVAAGAAVAMILGILQRPAEEVRPRVEPRPTKPRLWSSPGPRRPRRREPRP